VRVIGHKSRWLGSQPIESVVTLQRPV